jgi:hypothetical protein
MLGGATMSAGKDDDPKIKDYSKYPLNKLMSEDAYELFSDPQFQNSLASQFIKESKIERHHYIVIVHIPLVQAAA